MNQSGESFSGKIRSPQDIFHPWQASAPGLILGCALLLTLADLPYSFRPGETFLAAAVGLVALASVLSSVIELRAGSADPSGVYGFTREILSPPLSFLGGWSILLGTSAAAAFLANEAAQQIGVLYPSLPEGAVIPLGILSVVVLLELAGSPLRKMHWSLLFLILAGFLVLIGNTWVGFQPGAAAPHYTIDLKNSMHTAALLMMLFIPFEALLTVQAHQPSRFSSKSMLVLGGGTLVFMAAALGLTSRLDASLDPRPSLTTLLASSSSSSLLALTISILVILIGLHFALLTAARQLNALSRAGMLPDSLRRIRKPLKTPGLLFLLVMLLALPWILLKDSSLAAASGSSLLIISLILLNAAVMVSRIKEPERRRSFSVPLFPLIPSISIVLLGALLLSTPPETFLVNGILLAAGATVYFFYGKHHAAAAREDSISFKIENTASPEENNGRYRILLPLTPGQERHLALKIAVALARQLDASLIPLQVIPIPDPLAMEENRRVAWERSILFKWSLHLAEQVGVDIRPMTRFARNIPEGIVEAAVEENCDLILMPWTIGKPARGVQLGHILDPVLTGATCDVAVVTFPELRQPINGEKTLEPSALPEDIRFDFTPSRILVPTAGGPNAPLAFRFALSLANETGGSVTAVYVASPDSTEDELAAGQERINQTIEALKAEASKLAELQAGKHPLDSISFDSLVITAEKVADGIAEAGKDFDLILLGASEERIIDQMLLGTIPEQVARTSTHPAIMVRRFRGLQRYWLQRIWKLFFELVPTLSREERIEVYRTVRRDARPDIDYFIMMGLSTAIATFGLLQNSGAVIIGAMLVAPLFTPILALSLAIVQGDVPFFRVAFESSIKGIALAIGLALVLTSLSPLTELTQEIFVRSQPNMFDLLIALASGVAGAYAIARKDVATSLPGVAIAAALVPPLSVIGISLAHGNLVVAGGSTLLFLTNLVAIVLSGVLTLMLLGFLPRKRDHQNIRLRWAFLAALAALGLILIPLVSISTRTLRELTTEQAVTQILELEAERGNLVLEDFEIAYLSSSLDISVRILAEGLPDGFADHLREEIQAVSSTPVTLNLTIISVDTIQSLPESD